MARSLTKEERDILWNQFVEAYEKSQNSYDLTIRGLAGAGVAVTASLGTALGTFGTLGLGAAVAFLVSLAANLVSYPSAQRDLRKRLGDLQAERDSGVWGNRWTKLTAGLNWLAGLAFLAGGALLASYVASAS